MAGERHICLYSSAFALMIELIAPFKLCKGEDFSL